MALPKVGVQFVADDAQPFLKAVADGDKAVRGFGQTAAGVGPSFSSFEQIATGALRRVGEMAVNFALNAGQALLSFGGDSINVAADYESTLNRFSSVTGSAVTDAGLSLDQFSEKFLQLGIDTQFSAQQAADAGVELAKGGVPIEQIMGDATDATLALAAAGELELAPAAEIVAKTLGVWASTGVTATQAADLLAQAANASTVDVDELALGMANVGGTAKVAGLSLNETVQTMALLAPGFSSASDAGTSFKTFLSRLIPTTKDAAGMMEDLGLLTEDGASKFYDATGAFVGMEEASALLNAATKDLSNEQKILAFQTIFGQDAIRAAAIIAEQGAGGYNAMGDAMDKAGSAAAQAAERNKGFKFAQDQLAGSLETLQIILGTAVLPLLTTFLNDIILPGANALIGFAQALTAGGDPLAALGAMAATAGAVISAALPGIRQAFLDWALAAAAWVMDAAPLLLEGLGQLLQTVGNWAADAAITYGEQMLAFAQQAVAWIGPMLPALGEALGQFLNTMVTWVANSLPEWMARLQTLGMAAVKWVQDALPGLGTNLGQFAGKLLAWIAQTAIDVVPKLAALGVKFVAWIVTDVLPELVPTLLKIGEAIGNFIYEAGVALGPKIREFATKFYSWITEVVIPELPGLLGRAWDTISGWIDEAAGLAWTGAQHLGDQLIAGITEGVKAAAGALYDATIGVVADALAGVGEYLGIQSPSTLARDRIGIWILPGIAEGIVATAPVLEQTLVDSLGAALESGQAEIARGGQDLMVSLGQTFGQPIAGPDISGMLAAGRDLAASLVSAPRIGSGPRIQPAAPAPGWANQSSVTTNGPTITYSPTYNAPAPPPAMSYAALTALAGV
jgi:TP901 family phage tail tape measure protein